MFYHKEAPKDSIRSILEDENVVMFTKEPNGLITVDEGCDVYYSTSLTKEQLHKLADELHALADS